MDCCIFDPWTRKSILQMFCRILSGLPTHSFYHIKPSLQQAPTNRLLPNRTAFRAGPYKQWKYIYLGLGRTKYLPFLLPTEAQGNICSLIGTLLHGMVGRLLNVILLAFPGPELIMWFPQFHVPGRDERVALSLHVAASKHWLESQALSLGEWAGLRPSITLPCSSQAGLAHHWSFSFHHVSWDMGAFLFVFNFLHQRSIQREVEF